MSYLVDTNVISELRKTARQDRNVAAWFASVSGFDLYLSVLVLGELRKGVELIRKTNPAQAQALEIWLTGLPHVYTGRILSITGEIADEWGRMNALRPVSTIDGLQAATAKLHRLTFVTRNTADVRGLGVQMLNPFHSPSR